MTRVQYADEQVRDEILAVEERRRKALMSNDIAALDDLYDDSLVHIHAPGLIHNKAQLMEHVATNQAYLDMHRGPLTIRVVGDVAVVTGRLVNRLRTKEGGERSLGGPVTQVLRRCHDGAWRFLSFQMTPDGEREWPALASERADDENPAKESA
ncbi:ketosteroid isomerase-like protein [Branchiibius hedensis]|uniref:Ketosteroid isomerase homolog n=1 Tax=Branchiibius hedensis TaxID=672460 RepID=A0A2Y8ZVS2_9MICO|nr:nuclear transport factor 2 family protein [Branchiibius hedensis]PWJ26825.1 ketosteroid isomerase-like protein [Branchiibius hedensis]SSA35636.1 Ketosteroid isomerase homolog [Branchiibius hedensis]